MAQLPPTKYTNGELAIIIGNLDQKVDGINATLREFKDALLDLKQYKDEVTGAMRATIFWTSAICTLIMGLGAYAFTLTLDARDARIEKMINTKIADCEMRMSKFIDSKEIIITK